MRVPIHRLGQSTDAPVTLAGLLILDLVTFNGGNLMESEAAVKGVGRMPGIKEAKGLRARRRRRREGGAQTEAVCRSARQANADE